MSASDEAGRGEAGRTPGPLEERELRRLVNLIQYAVRGLPYHQDPIEPILRPLLTEREDLVAALRKIVAVARGEGADDEFYIDIALAALSKAEGGTHG